MHDSDQSGASEQCETPPFSASDFSRIGWTRLDCIAADAKSAGKAVMYSDDAGFVAVQCEDDPVALPPEAWVP